MKLWPFKRAPKPAPPPPDPTYYDLPGDWTWTLIADALKARGLVLRRGTGHLQRDKFGDGKWHLRFNADPIAPAVTEPPVHIDCPKRCDDANADSP